jgi:hydrogenase/urease accessory protein HupE
MYLLHVMGIAGGIILQKMNIEKVVRFVGGAIALVGVYLAMT